MDWSFVARGKFMLINLVFRAFRAVQA